MTMLFLRTVEWWGRLRAKAGEARQELRQRLGDAGILAGGPRAAQEEIPAVTDPGWGSEGPEAQTICCRGVETLPSSF